MSVVKLPVGRVLVALVVCSVFLKPALADDIDDYVMLQMHKQRIPGLSLAVVRDGKVVKSEGYGLASVELGAPAAATTVYRIGSLTTQFTAVLTLMMVESGKLKLDDPISKYLAHTPPAWAKVTIRHLLNHTSGIRDYTGVAGWRRDAVRPIGAAEIIRYVAPYPLGFPPGTACVYSRTGYSLLGAILETVSGKPYSALLAEHITTPLAMSATRLDDPAEIVPNRANGYTHAIGGGPLQNAGFVDMSWLESASGLRSSVDDLAKWAAAITTGTLVNRALMDQMTVLPRLNEDTFGKYGSGWEVETLKGHRLLQNSAGNIGFASDMSAFSDDKVTVVVLANSDDAVLSSIANGVASFYIPALSTASEKPIPDSEPKVTALVRDIFTKFAAGNGDPGVFTPEMWKLIQPSIENPAQYRSLGSLFSVDLLNHENVPAISVRTYQYRMNYEQGTLVVDLVLDAAGKVSSLRIRPE